MYHKSNESYSNDQSHNQSRSKRSCVSDSRRSLSDFIVESDEDDDNKSVRSNPKRNEFSIGRGRGRPPTHREDDIYVFSTKIVNAFINCINSNLEPDSIIEWHRKAIKFRGNITREAEDQIVRNVMRYKENKLNPKPIPTPAPKAMPSLVRPPVQIHSQRWSTPTPFNINSPYNQNPMQMYTPMGTQQYALQSQLAAHQPHMRFPNYAELSQPRMATPSYLRHESMMFPSVGNQSLAAMPFPKISNDMPPPLRTVANEQSVGPLPNAPTYEKNDL